MHKKIQKLINNVCQSASVCTWSIGSTPKKNLQIMALDLDEKIKAIVKLDKGIIFDSEFEKILPPVNMLRRAAGMEEMTCVDYMPISECNV